LDKTGKVEASFAQNLLPPLAGALPEGALKMARQ
jgi:hypothetical protein